MQVHTHSEERVYENRRQGQSQQPATNSADFVETCRTGARNSYSETETLNEASIPPLIDQH